MADTKNYDQVASVIGDEMDKAWKNIMSRLAAGDAAGLTTFAGTPLSATDINDFFEVLGGAQMEINFASKVPKGVTLRCTGTEIKTTTAGPVALGSGELSFSIGGTYRY